VPRVSRGSRPGRVRRITLRKRSVRQTSVDSKHTAQVMREDSPGFQIMPGPGLEKRESRVHCWFVTSTLPPLSRRTIIREAPTSSS
jgi:hypothetical protein